MSSLKMTVGDDCGVSACNPALSTLYKSARSLLVGVEESAFGQMSAIPPLQLQASKIKHTFLSTNLACLLAFISQTPLPTPATPFDNKGKVALPHLLSCDKATMQELRFMHLLYTRYSSNALFKHLSFLPHSCQEHISSPLFKSEKKKNGYVCQISCPKLAEKWQIHFKFGFSTSKSHTPSNTPSDFNQLVNLFCLSSHCS